MWKWSRMFVKRSRFRKETSHFLVGHRRTVRRVASVIFFTNFRRMPELLAYRSRHHTMDTKQPPCEDLRPKARESEVKEFLEWKYGFKVISMKPLDSYYDQNIHILVDEGNYVSSGDSKNTSSRPTHEAGYLVKIFNRLESKDPGILEVQPLVIQHLIDRGITCQYTVKTLDGQDLCDYRINGTDQVHKLCVRRFLRGQILTNINKIGGQYLYDFGNLVARIKIALQDFYDPFFASHDCLWSIDNVLCVSNCLHCVLDTKRRAICEDVLKVFQREALPEIPKLRTGQIHGDLNDQNIIVAAHADTGELYCNDHLQFVGVIDYAHTLHTYCVSDLTISAAYAMGLAHLQDVHFLDVPGYMLAGYTSLVSLNEAERGIFRIFIAARLVQSAVFGTHACSQDPDNKYALRSANKAWTTLQLFWETPSEELESRWNSIVSSMKDVNE